MLSSDPGLPLGPDDFFLARQLPIERAINLTAESKMKPLRMRYRGYGDENPDDDQTVETLEVKGNMHEINAAAGTKNGLSKLT